MTTPYVEIITKSLRHLTAELNERYRYGWDLGADLSHGTGVQCLFKYRDPYGLEVDESFHITFDFQQELPSPEMVPPPTLPDPLVQDALIRVPIKGGRLLLWITDIRLFEVTDGRILMWTSVYESPFEVLCTEEALKTVLAKWAPVYDIPESPASA